ncbi:hydantoinase/oxoprolinase family protein [Gloeobacter kilaueensis]|uniref:5-oxoprolinase (ATP-hydrolyzing) n=1 Tax=Gloeobacter kilaueensis (strain ATCC BAA-2537 / CCAP 1431/1 / ULC 316 / JS1) TaxID=1183438 RepID=U5QBT3_GLOK1|nr:hydantoinase/oxoprolinase family protein [Gloeobacter kilaueensis]AGY56278.1 5-oxoprolinase (ATP-hydrolyzing) [Gloeobacter kilaueensis JS1]
MGSIRLGVDVGGTFTDLVLIAGGRVITAKVPTSAEQSEGVIEAFERTGIDPAEVQVFAHGMTVATNALLEGKGAPTAFITTEGFRDVLTIARQNRPHLYDLTRQRPRPLVAREHCLTVRERMGPAGVIEPLDPVSLQQVIATLDPLVAAGQIRAIAVGLLFAFRYPAHEQAVARALRKAFPEIHLSLSTEVAPEFREYERFSTAVVDAYLSPALHFYLRRLATRCQERRLPVPQIMQSSGGVTTIGEVRAAAALLSGPAGGVRGAAFVAAQSGYPDVLAFDMGGTSTDVSLILDSTPQTSAAAVVAGYPVRLPQIDIHTVSAGGGSIAWADSGGALQVGPHSAGSIPGPAAYGRGGNEPTVSDANVLLGYLADGALLGGALTIDRQRALVVIKDLATRLGLSDERAAVGIREVANAHMVTALRVMSIERGIDPRRLALLAFGGAGPMHGCDLAQALGITRVLVPEAGGVLSALGLAVSPLRRDFSLAVLQSLGGLGDSWRSFFETLEKQAPPALAERQYFADLRYRGQSFELTVPLSLQEELAALVERFHAVHARRYGWADPQQPIEWVQARLIATEALALPELRAPEADSGAQRGLRTAWFGGAWQSVPVFDRTRMGAGSTIAGPALIEMPEATVVVQPGWAGAIDRCGTLVLEFVNKSEDLQAD